MSRPSSITTACRVAVATFWAVLACRADRRGDPIDLLVPDGSGRTLQIVPRSAFAEYVEIPDAMNELRLTFATHEVSCERHVPPRPEDFVVVVTLRLPPAEKPRPASYASTAAPPPTDAGAPSPSRQHVQAVVRRGSRAYVLLPGGRLELSSVDLEPTGGVRGALALEFAGDGAHPASTVRGKFLARICRSDPDPGPR